MRVLIADDEEIARKRLLRLLREVPDVTVVGECRDGIEVLRAVKESPADVLLLDIQMPGLTGLEAMALMPEDGPYVIFCTAYADHAVAAFDVGAVDYLLKPVEQDRLEKALARARSRETVERFRAETAKVRESAKDGLNRLAIPTRSGIVLIDPREITHAVLEGELVTIHTPAGELLTDQSLQALQDRLPDTVVRVHRKALLSLVHVSKLENADTGGMIAHVPPGHRVEISRQAARALRKRLGLRKPDGAPDDP
ncbi:MAG: response regulator [Polyangiaceae bacterium]|jgi:two-component system, LytTR family, response regulator|nr:response regulator [Polyangiaceae bacterium]